MLVNESPWCYDTRYLSSVLRIHLRPLWCIVQEFIADGDMFVEVLHKDFKVAIKLVGWKAGLGASANSRKDCYGIHH